MATLRNVAVLVGSLRKESFNRIERIRAKYVRVDAADLASADDARASSQAADAAASSESQSMK